jgi:uroporphyrin-III C-methyltransferase
MTNPPDPVATSGSTIAKPSLSHEVTAARAGQSLGTVFLCGAGPGDPELLTLRAARLLATCDVILPDDLVSDEILALANPRAEIIPVGKRCGQPRITQAGIHELLLLHARRGRSVLRLKSGDPLVFGRAGEEIDALTAARIPFEIVPGITSAFAVAASLKTPLTDRAAASRLILATAHHSASKPLPPVWMPAWQGAFPAEATLVLYMPGRDFPRLSAELIASGIPPGTPVAAVSRASTPHEQVTATTLAGLAHAVPGPAPLLLLIGQAIRLP